MAGQLLPVRSAVADQVTPEPLKLRIPFPPQSDILAVEIKTATRVAKLVIASGPARGNLSEGSPAPAGLLFIGLS